MFWSFIATENHRGGLCLLIRDFVFPSFALGHFDDRLGENRFS